MSRETYLKLWKTPGYWLAVRAIAGDLKADGCTGVPDFYRDGCLEHDIMYRTHHDLFGISITKEEADLRLKWYIQAHSWFGSWSPMAWWRYRALNKWCVNTSQAAWDSYGGLK